METKKRLRDIIEKGSVTAEDKRFIVDLSKKLEVPFEPKSTKCKDCYIDQAAVLYGKVDGEDPKASKARLRDDIDVVINGTRINNATLTDELVEKYRGKGLPEHWFV